MLRSKTDGVTTPEQNTLRSGKTNSQFAVIQESAEQKEDSEESFKSSPASNISDSEAASIIAQSTISKATMKKLTLVRRPTIEENMLQSPKKLRTTVDFQGPSVKEQIAENSNKIYEKITDEYKERMKMEKEMVRKLENFRLIWKSKNDIQRLKSSILPCQKCSRKQSLTSSVTSRQKLSEDSKPAMISKEGLKNLIPELAQ